METSVARCEEETIFGMTWQQVFRLRNYLARKYYEKFRESVPLEELWSAANLAIAETLTKFDPDSGAATYRTYLKRALHYAFFTAWYHEHKGRLAYQYTPDRKRTIRRREAPALSLDLHPIPIPVHVPYENHHDFQRLLHHLSTITTARERSILMMSLAGETNPAIGARHGLKETRTYTIIQQVLQRLQTWAYVGYVGQELPPRQRRLQTLLTPKDRQTVVRLAREGMPKRAIARRFGCGQKQVTKILQQGGNTQTARVPLGDGSRAVQNEGRMQTSRQKSGKTEAGK